MKITNRELGEGVEMGRRAGNGKGGMQSAGLSYSIICPKCQKPAARREDDFEHGILRYLHFTKTGSKWHEVSIYEVEKKCMK